MDGASAHGNDRSDLASPQGDGALAQAPAGDAVEDLWRTYYGSIFNPARIKERTMAAQMARRYWKNLPEAQDIPKLLAQAPARVDAMHELKKLNPPCALCMRAPWRVVRDVNGARRAICQECGNRAELDARVVSNRIKRAAMKRR